MSRLFSPREQTIASLVSEGLSNRAIAEKLSLSEYSVKSHLHTVFKQLHLRRRIDLVIDRPKSVERSAVLTDRQKRVATLVCGGLSNREIAMKLGVAEGTVKIHLHGIYQRLNVHSRNELANTLAH